MTFPDFSPYYLPSGWLLFLPTVTDLPTCGFRLNDPVLSQLWCFRVLRKYRLSLLKTLYLLVSACSFQFILPQKCTNCEHFSACTGPGWSHFQVCRQAELFHSYVPQCMPFSPSKCLFPVYLEHIQPPNKKKPYSSLNSSSGTVWCMNTFLTPPVSP